VYQLAVTRTDPTTLITTPVDITGASIRFTVKTSSGDTDANAIIKKGTTDTGLGGIVPVDAPNGLAQITVSPADTSTLSAPTWYAYDIQLRETSGRVTTVQSGRFLIKSDITSTSS
jgi:hypothetical protein